MLQGSDTHPHSQPILKRPWEGDLDKALFLKERLPHKLVSVGNEALTTADQIFARVVGLPVREMRILRIVDDNPGITFVDIVAATNQERSSVSRTIQKLLKQNLIERRATENDARRYLLFASREGKAMRDMARDLSNRLEAIVLTPLEAGEVAQVNLAMVKMMDWLASDNYREMLADCLADWSARAAR